ncbi:hypothetical protein MKP09_13580 [Niabella ginsengisoli]|uniref:catalase n=1 Tax=Niabella ginsengisoli TaxID=522298 RepID=A0ABS9SL32_9BACT|nr:hypothetical protein [Niabella ginsengisoli]
MFDAVYIPGNAQHAEALLSEPDAIHFVNEQYRHCKAIGGSPKAEKFFEATYVRKGPGITMNGDSQNFISNIAQHRFWEREMERKVPA